MLEILLIVCVLLLSFIVIYLIFFYNKKETNRQEDVKEKKFYNLVQKENDKSVEVILTVNYQDFLFSHPKKNSNEIKKIGQFIKESIAIIETSKYNDIIASRVEEIDRKLKLLMEMSTFSKGQYSSVKKEVIDFSNRIKAK